MSPLDKFKSLENLKKDLLILKSNGISGITTDVWWGIVEKNKDVYDWDYYLELIKVISDCSLKWIPILSFHSCGDNVNDDTDIKLPVYVSEYGEKNISFYDCKYRMNSEYISFWFKPILERYEFFMKSFDKTFSSYYNIIEKIYISFGPAGELRYPSYNFNVGWKYPMTGLLQCYSPLAKQSFYNFLFKKYSDVGRLNKSWNTLYNSFDDINLPYNSYDFLHQYYYTTKFGRDTLSWYEQSLHQHFEDLATISKKVFPSTMKLGGKISGVHWKYYCGNFAEKAAGYVDHEYKTITHLFRKHKFELTITCLEMKSNEESGIDQILEKIYSSTKNKISLNGENALPLDKLDISAWEQVKNNLSKYKIKNFTLLRWNNLFKDNKLNEEYLELIKKYLI